MAAKITNREGSSRKSKALGWLRFEREARDEETKVRPALQAGGRQCIIIPCLQKLRERQGAGSFPGIGAGRALSRWGLGSLTPTGSPAGHQRPSHS